MKHKIIIDILVYMVSPVLIFSISRLKYSIYSILAVVIISILYTMRTKSNQNRINLSGLLFTAMCSIFFAFSRNAKSGYEIYILETYGLVLISIFIPLSKILRKDIFKQIYIDILKAIGYNNLNIWNLFKNDKVENELNDMSLVVSLNILVIMSIKIYSIISYGSEGYFVTLDLEILAMMLFIIGEIYMMSRLISVSKKNEKIKNKKNKQIPSGKVISLKKYKNTNK